MSPPASQDHWEAFCPHSVTSWDGAEEVTHPYGNLIPPPVKKALLSLVSFASHPLAGLDMHSGDQGGGWGNRERRETCRGRTREQDPELVVFGRVPARPDGASVCTPTTRQASPCSREGRGPWQGPRTVRGGHTDPPTSPQGARLLQFLFRR